jgi:hypothetical protein
MPWSLFTAVQLPFYFKKKKNNKGGDSKIQAQLEFILFY